MMIDASLNEVDGMAAKAARGAGLAWGLAEETGRAARWLAACGIDWAPSLVALLGQHADLAAPVTCPPGPLQAASPDSLLSPLLTGAYLDDLGASAGDLILQATAFPLWLVPFAASAASKIEAVVVIGWGDLSITVWPFSGELAGDVAALHAPQAKTVTWAHLAAGTVAAPRPRRCSAQAAVSSGPAIGKPWRSSARAPTCHRQNDRVPRAPARVRRSTTTDRLGAGAADTRLRRAQRPPYFRTR